LRGAEGIARQATLKEAVLAKKKKGAKMARRQFKKEKEIGRQVRGGESQSDMEVELESEEPTEMEGDASTSEDELDRGIVATSVERREPMAASVGGGRDAEKHGDIPKLRKHTVREDTAVEREAKRAWSPRPSEASLASPSLLRAWRGTPADRRSMLVPLHLWGRCMRVTHNEQMPR